MAKVLVELVIWWIKAVVTSLYGSFGYSELAPTSREPFYLMSIEAIFLISS